MRPFQVLLILKARAKLIGIVLLITLIPAAVISLMLPKTYKATTSILLNYKGFDPLTGSTKPGYHVSGYLPTYMSTQIDIIKSIRVAQHVVEKLKLHESEKYTDSFNTADMSADEIKARISAMIAGKLEVKPSRESSVINLSYKSSNPQDAAEFVNAFAQAYQELGVRLEVDPSESTYAYLNDNLKKIRDEFEAAQNKVSNYQQQHGIVNSDNRVDVENSHLNELSNQLAVAQSQFMEASSRKNFSEGAKAFDSPDVANNPLIHNLKAEINKAQAKLSALSKIYTAEHPTYQASSAELNKLKAELRGQVGILSNAVSNNANIHAKRVSELKAAVEFQKNKVMDLNRKRDELALLIKDMETAQRTYEAVSQRLAQTRMQAKATQSDIAILYPASTPLSPAYPIVRLTVLIAAVIGIVLGVIVAFVVELMDRRIRSAKDFEHLTNIPVLAVVDDKRALPSPTRALLGGPTIRGLLGN